MTRVLRGPGAAMGAYLMLFIVTWAGSAASMVSRIAGIVIVALLARAAAGGSRVARMLLIILTMLSELPLLVNTGQPTAAWVRSAAFGVLLVQLALLVSTPAR